MKREILFRGMRMDGKGWVYGHYVIDPKGCHRIYWKPFEEATSNTYHLVKPETVGQFTGETDWDSQTDDHEPKRIYEGDRCVMDSIHVGVPHCGREGVVVFRECAFWLDFGDDAVPVWSDAYYLTIVGNIHTP